MIESALKTIHLDDDFLRYILTCCHINQACYLLMDNLLWLNSIGIINLNKKSTKINEWSNKFWLFSSILYLARDLHDLIGLIQSLDEDLKKNLILLVDIHLTKNQELTLRLDQAYNQE